MAATVHKLSIHDKPERNERVWLWRDDSERWVIERFTEAIARHIGNQQLAYTHWARIEYPPTPMS